MSSVKSVRTIADQKPTSDPQRRAGSTDRPAADPPSEAELQRRLARKEEVLRLLKDVAVVMNEASSVDDALSYVVERVCTFAGWPVGHVYLTSSKQQDLLVPTAVFHLSDPERYKAFGEATMDTSFRKNVGLPGRVLATRAPVWINNIAEDPNFPRARLVQDIGVTSGFGFPVMTGEKVTGVLEFFSVEMTEPDHELLDAMANVGAQLGRVIEREKAAEEIRASEERLRTLTSSTVEAIITANERGLITDWAGGSERIFGYTADEVRGRDLVMLMPDRYVAAHREGFARYLKTGEPRIIGHTVEIEARRKDGTELPVELSLSAWKAGGVQFFTAVIRDITERKRSEDRLREREQQLERAQRIAHLGSWQFELPDGPVEWSDELCRIYGVDPGSRPTFEEYMDMVHPEDREPARSAIARAMETHEPFSLYHRIIRQSDGEERILHGEGEVVVDDKGRPIRMFGTALDVTELKRTEQTLRERERLFRLLAENMSDVILLQASSGEVTYASPSSKRVLGYEPDELEGRNLFELLEDADAERLRAGSYQHMLNDKRYTEAVARARHASGTTVWLELASKPIVGEDGQVQHILSSARDVTERIRAEEDANRYRSELEKRNRELQDFAYVASHDLQEPLRKIRAFSGLLEEDYGDRLDEEALGYLDRVKDAAARMSTLISDLLEFSRITTKGEPFAVIDLNKVVSGVMSDLEVAISESGAEIEIDDLPDIQADALQMRQLFQNLIANALKFSRDDVTPRIRVTAAVLDKREGKRAGGSPVCRIVVEDNGIGFEAKFADRIFTPFQRLHHQREYEGTGMGLAICRRIVERHEGTIAADSAPGEGATFTIELPVYQSVES